MPSRTLLAALAVVSTFVPPMDATTAPIDCGANLPVSKESVLSVPDTGPDTEMGSATNGSFHVHSALECASGASEPVPSWQARTPPADLDEEGGDSDSATGNRQRFARVAKPDVPTSFPDATAAGRRNVSATQTALRQRRRPWSAMILR